MSPLMHFLRKLLGLSVDVAKDVIVEQVEKRAGQRMPPPITDEDLGRDDKTPRSGTRRRP